MTKSENKGVSTVFGAVLFLILITTLVSTIFVSLYQYDKNAQTALMLEEKRTQEKAIIDALITDAEITTIEAIHVNNTGSLAARIRAVYIDGTLIFDPSTYINSKSDSWIFFPSPQPFIFTSKITIASERGVRSVVKEGDLVSVSTPPQPEVELYFGPLKLDYVKFFYGEYNVDGTYPAPPGWKQGWTVETNTEIVWNITVTNIDDRSVTLSRYSTFTLVPNKEGAQDPWYIEKVLHKDGSVSPIIVPGETVDITYRWSTSGQTKHESTPASEGQFRVFLTFYGTFNENSGKSQPYGQTIPFEAVLITKS